MRDAVFPGRLEQIVIDLEALLSLRGEPGGSTAIHQLNQWVEVGGERLDIRFALGAECFEDRLLKQRQLAVERQKIRCGRMLGSKLRGALNPRVKTPVHSWGGTPPVTRKYHRR